MSITFPTSAQEGLVVTRMLRIQDFTSPADAGDTGIALRRIRDQGKLTPGTGVLLSAGDWKLQSPDPSSPSMAFLMQDLSRVALIGEGPNITRLYVEAGANIGAINLRRLTGVSISGIGFYGQRTLQPAVTRSGRHLIRGEDLESCVVEDCDLDGALGYNIGLQVGVFARNRFSRLKLTNSGADLFDFKNSAAGNTGNVVEDVLFRGWGLNEPLAAKAALDIRGGVRVSRCAVYMDSATGNAANHVAFRVRPDASDTITYANASALPTENLAVAGRTSGATATVRVVSGTATLAVGGLALEDTVGVFQAGEIIDLLGGVVPITATVQSYATGSNNGGGDSVFDSCLAQGPKNGVALVGYSISDTRVVLQAPTAFDVLDAVSVQSSGASATVVAPTIARCRTGILTESTNLRVVGGTIANATDRCISILNANGTHIAGTHMRDSTVGVVHQGSSTGSYFDALRFASVATPVGNMPAGTFSVNDTPEFSAANVIGGSVRFPSVPANRTGLSSGDMYTQGGFFRVAGATQEAALPARRSLRAAAIFGPHTEGYVGGNAVVGAAGGAASAVLYFAPIHIPHRVSLFRLGTVIGTAAAGVSAKFALYASLVASGGEQTPEGAARLAVGDAAVSMAGAANTQARGSFAASLVVEPGFYFGAFVADGAARPYTVGTTIPFRWAEMNGINNAAFLFGASGGPNRLAATALVDYANPFPALGPAVTLSAEATGSPFLFAQMS